MKYRLVERRNPSKPEAPKKWHINPVSAGKVSVRDFSKEIAGRTTIKRGDIETVLSNFIELLPAFIQEGKSVKLGDVGTIRIGVSSEGVLYKSQFSLGKIKGVRVIFTPSKELKKKLATTTFEAE